MTHSQVPRKPAPSPWAVGLFVASSGFALLSLYLASTEFMPL